jgi:hypothetical protein
MILAKRQMLQSLLRLVRSSSTCIHHSLLVFIDQDPDQPGSEHNQEQLIAVLTPSDDLAPGETPRNASARSKKSKTKRTKPRQKV